MATHRKNRSIRNGFIGTHVPRRRGTLTRDEYNARVRRERCTHDHWIDGEWLQCENRDTVETPAGFLCSEHSTPYMKAAS